MKKTLWLLPVIVLWVLAPIPIKHQAGTYNTLSHLAYCESRAVCMHEIAHALDQRAGWVSQTPAFYQALELYLYVEMRKPELTEAPADILELTYRSEDRMLYIKMELYAYLFQWAEGKPEKMPDGLRKFYNWDLARQWLARLNGQQQLYWMN